MRGRYRLPPGPMPSTPAAIAEAESIVDYVAAGLSEDVATKEQIEALTRAIADLPAIQRQVVMLAYGESLPLDDIAWVLDLAGGIEASDLLDQAIARCRLALSAAEPRR